ncbi:electron transfer flavoprotein subunit beta/FixA family protein [bacterium]|nr:electron transfer flavoprotein subunit beta/FixA family protein [bacterium]
MIRIAVLLKQVPDIERNVKVTINANSYNINRQGVPSIMNPHDRNALEEALCWKDQVGAEVVCFSMGPTQAAEILKEAISMGADESYLITDRLFAGSDTLATSLILSEALKKTGPFTYVFCGKQALDGDTAQVGPGVAVRLQMPQVLNVQRTLIRSAEQFVVQRDYRNSIETIAVPTHSLVSLCKHANTPRLPSLRGLFLCHTYQPTLLTNQELKISPERIGLEGSPTRVVNTFTPQLDKTIQKLKPENGQALFQIIKSKMNEVMG